AQSEPPSTSPPATAAEQVTVQPVSGSTAQPKITGTGDVDGGLVITRDGKVVFRSPAQHVKHAAGDTPKAGTTNADVSQLRLPSDVAEHYLVTRVEPEYPEQARKDQVQGSVLLDALVGKDGAVQKVTPVSGNPELVQAATQAIQQWRFRPYLNNGQPQEFTTQVNVVFRLP
ncbi:MAG TPA: energy transducer TonB, partial [Terriglobales bacterium]|nr:energy transducer TonB [Terriglobales bacterium]